MESENFGEHITGGVIFTILLKQGKQETQWKTFSLQLWQGPQKTYVRKTQVMS
jgi:hypothetical protein